MKSLSCIKHLPFGHAKMGHVNAKEGCVRKRVLEMQCACMCIHQLSRKALNNIVSHAQHSPEKGPFHPLSQIIMVFALGKGNMKGMQKTVLPGINQFPKGSNFL